MPELLKDARKLRSILSADVKANDLLIADDEAQTFRNLETYGTRMP